MPTDPSVENKVILDIFKKEGAEDPERVLRMRVHELEESGLVYRQLDASSPIGFSAIGPGGRNCPKAFIDMLKCILYYGDAIGFWVGRNANEDVGGKAYHSLQSAGRDFDRQSDRDWANDTLYMLERKLAAEGEKR